MRSLRPLSLLVLLPIITSSCARQESSEMSEKSGTTAYPTVGSIERLDPALDAIIAPDSPIELLAEGHEWTEGPVWVKNGEFLLYSDIPDNAIYKWTEDHGAELWLQPSGYTGEDVHGGESGSNGLLLDAEGRLVLCQHGDRRIARLESDLSNPEPSFVTLADTYNGKRFNSPNDAVYHTNGQLFFTDPPYGLMGGVDGPHRELTFQGVYRLDTDGSVTLLTDEFNRPNGIGLSPGEDLLYVASSDGENQPYIKVFDLNESGNISNGRIFFDSRESPAGRVGGFDGMKVDRQGNVFATGPGGVLVIASDGKHLGTVLTTQATANCAFGDDGSMLYITADPYLLRVQTKTTGLGF